MRVIANNSPLRYLLLLDCIHLLPTLFGRVMIPPEVQAELQHRRTPGVVQAWIAHPPAWVDVRPVSGRSCIATLRIIPSHPKTG